MEKDVSHELLGLYKLHAELADRVSQRRELANRLYVSLLTGFLVFLAAVLRFGTDQILGWIIALAGGFMGLSLSFSWFIVIRSYRQLNSAKFAVLHELEEDLSFPFFKKEWDCVKQGKDWKKYAKLTTVETIMPIIFAIFFLILIVAALWIACR